MGRATPSGDSPTEDLIRLSFFTETAKAIAQAQTLRQTLLEVMNQVGRIFRPRNWSLLLRDSRTGELTFTLVTGDKEATALRGQKIERGKGIAGWIAENGQPAIVENVDVDERFDPTMDRLSEFKTKSIIGVPLLTKERVFGVIELINKLNGEPFTPLDLKLLSTIADFAAIAIEKAYYLRALSRVASIDSLTGAYNRRSFIRIMGREIERCHRFKNGLAAVMVDIDSFKQINDTHGHAAGDEVLKHLSALMLRNVRTIDYVFRYGGDEFVILMPDADESAAEQVKHRISSGLDNPDDQRPVDYAVSMGMYCGCPESLDEVLDAADMGLYAEKDKRQPARERLIEEVDRHISSVVEEDLT